jgi:hypothetical protein
VNQENFEHWMLTKLLPNLEELSLTVMDNASYHSGETSSTELDKGQDNCLSAREFSFQRELLKLNYHISQQPMGPKEGGEAMLLIFFSLPNR